MNVRFNHNTPQLHEVLGLTKEQADKIVDILVEITGNIKSLSEGIEQLLKRGLKDNELIYAIVMLREAMLGRIAWNLAQDTALFVTKEKEIIKDTVKHILNLAFFVEEHGMPGDAKKFLLHVMVGVGASLMMLSCLNPQTRQVDRMCVSAVLDGIRASSFLVEDLFNEMVGIANKSAFWKRFSI